MKGCVGSVRSARATSPGGSGCGLKPTRTPGLIGPGPDVAKVSRSPGNVTTVFTTLARAAPGDARIAVTRKDPAKSAQLLLMLDLHVLAAHHILAQIAARRHRPKGP